MAPPVDWPEPVAQQVAVFPAVVLAAERGHFQPGVGHLQQADRHSVALPRCQEPLAGQAVR